MVAHQDDAPLRKRHRNEQVERVGSRSLVHNHRAKDGVRAMLRVRHRAADGLLACGRQHHGVVAQGIPCTLGVLLQGSKPIIDGEVRPRRGPLGSLGKGVDHAHDHVLGIRMARVRQHRICWAQAIEQGVLDRSDVP